MVASAPLRIELPTNLHQTLANGFEGPVTNVAGDAHWRRLKNEQRRISASLSFEQARAKAYFGASAPSALPQLTWGDIHQGSQGQQSHIQSKVRHERPTRRSAIRRHCENSAHDPASVSVSTGGSHRLDAWRGALRRRKECLDQRTTVSGALSRQSGISRRADHRAWRRRPASPARRRKSLKV